MGGFVQNYAPSNKSTHNFVCFLIAANEQDRMIPREFNGEMAR
jgi:hypothetical protein